MSGPNRCKVLARLGLLAGMTRDAELARLAGVAQSRQRLTAALVALKEAEQPLAHAPGGALDPALIAAQLSHRRWIEAQQRRLNQQLALVTADWLRQKPAAARAFGRAAVLEDLTEQARLQARRDAQRKRDSP